MISRQATYCFSVEVYKIKLIRTKLMTKVVWYNKRSAAYCCKVCTVSAALIFFVAFQSVYSVGDLVVLVIHGLIDFSQNWVELFFLFCFIMKISDR